jgi:hypothetical protein
LIGEFRLIGLCIDIVKVFLIREARILILDFIKIIFIRKGESVLATVDGPKQEDNK